MRAGMLVAIIAAGFLTVGCAQNRHSLTQAAAQWTRLKPKLPEARPDVVELHYIFLQVDPTDPEIAKKVWNEAADEQCIPLDTKASLAANGLRLGKLGSRLPPELLDLVSGDKQNGSGRRHHATSGQLAKVQLTEILPTWNVLHVVGGKPQGDALEEAQGFLYLTPTIVGENTVSLEVAPEIEYGPRVQKRVPTPDLAGWQLRNDRATKAFPELHAKVELANGEYIIVGAIPDQGATLGSKLFVNEEGVKPIHTILLVRVVRPNREELLTAGYDFDDFFLTPLRQASNDRSTPVLETVMASRRIDMLNAR